MFKLCNKWRKIFIRIRKIKNVAINIAIYHIEKLNEIAQQLNDILNKTYIENNKSVTVGASIGGVIIKKDMNFKEIYKKADNALYRVKNSKKGSYFIDNN